MSTATLGTQFFIKDTYRGCMTTIKFQKYPAEMLHKLEPEPHAWLESVLHGVCERHPDISSWAQHDLVRDIVLSKVLTSDKHKFHQEQLWRGIDWSFLNKNK